MKDYNVFETYDRILADFEDLESERYEINRLNEPSGLPFNSFDLVQAVLLMEAE